MNILLLDTAFAAAPIYDGLVEAGHDVWVMGNRRSDLLARAAGDLWIDQDYSDVDSVRAHIDRLDIKRVVPGCTDASIETVVQLPSYAHSLGSADANISLSHKGQFRALCETLDLPAPRVVGAASFPRLGLYICKPVDAFSGRGISVFDGTDATGLVAALADARASSRIGEALIETHVGGQLYSCSGFLEDCAFTNVFFVREGSSANPFAVDTSYVVHDMPSNHATTLTASLERLARYLNLKDGLLHTQFILSGDTPMIVEVSRRCPGDLYPLLVEYSTGLRYAAKYAASCAGYPYNTKSRERRHVLRHTVTADERTEYGGVILHRPARVRAFYPIAKMGDELLERQGNRAGIIFSEYENAAELHAAYASFMARKAYRVTGAFGAAWQVDSCRGEALRGQ